MPNVIIRRYNTFFDHKTNVQFNPVLDRSSGLYIGLAVVPIDLISHFSGNSAFEVVTDEQLAAIVAGAQSESPAQTAQNLAMELICGDVLPDAEPRTKR